MAGKVVKLGFEKVEDEEEKSEPIPAEDQLLLDAIAAIEGEQNRQGEELQTLKNQLQRQQYDRTPEGQKEIKQRETDLSVREKSAKEVAATYALKQLAARRLCVLDHLVDEAQGRFKISDVELTRKMNTMDSGGVVWEWWKDAEIVKKSG